ncbi:MAG: DMT family transporter [Eubacteriaceae bacterium]|nr:DMT family transporter [Eubacteriaceae bacterium]
MRKDYVSVILAIIFFSTLAPMVKIAVGGMGSMQLLCLSTAFGTVFMIGICARNKLGSVVRSYKLKDWAIMSGMGLLGVFLTSGLYYYGIKVMRVQDACIINYLWPIMVILMSCIFLKEKLTVRKIFAALLSFFAVVIVATQGNITSLHFSSLSGVISCIGGAVAYGIFCALNKKLNYNSYISLTVYYAATAIMGAVTVPFLGGFSSFGGTQLIGVILIGIFPMSLGYFFWLRALEYGDTAKISILAYATPFVTLALSHFLLGETISMSSLIGLFVLIAGIFVQIRGKDEIAEKAGSSANAADVA